MNYTFMIIILIELVLLFLLISKNSIGWHKVTQTVEPVYRELYKHKIRTKGYYRGKIVYENERIFKETGRLKLDKYHEKSKAIIAIKKIAKNKRK